MVGVGGLKPLEPLKPSAPAPGGLAKPEELGAGQGKGMYGHEGFPSGHAAQPQTPRLLEHQPLKGWCSSYQFMLGQCCYERFRAGLAS